MSSTCGVASRALAVVVVIAMLGWGGVRAASAIFDAQGQHASATFATSALYAPAGLTASYVGTTTSLAWSAGTNGNGYAVLGAANGSSSTCSTASFSVLGSTSSLAYPDTRATPAGTWYCYQVRTTYGSWSSVVGNPTVAVQIGFFASTATVANGGVAGQLDTGDQIVLTFSQPVDPATGPTANDGVCTTSTALVLLGTSTGTGPCSTTEITTVGTLSGGTSATNSRWGATWVWSNGNRALTATIGGRTVGGGNTVVGGTWTYNPVSTPTSLLSASGSLHVCDTDSGGGNCLPAATGSF